MIKVNSALQQDKIIELLNDFEEDGITFTYSKKQGISLVFETNAEDLEKAAKLAKSTIKGQSWGSVLYFQVVPA
ncbi:hypothetical protein SAMN04488100_12132 [Alkalibacterium putridalgicola]|uniref:Uncharacterized protein n=1 Tax=Alkalibacterium putridalgicola TaxID=426703 RepID=A0A1H7V2F6_9LACT|nr:hypothetical protein [Alkalibacterium putridalgicola]GEK89673.1 hypothetical protein APU01nite_17120 [Alkalibacterium putridalgicola]SEM03333.1 hypothetical protein SAMN04488100_12132 [Alkalibacterium putridalgicola]